MPKGGGISMIFMFLVLGTPSHAQPCAIIPQGDIGCPFYKMEIPSLDWCIVDRFNKFGLSFYVKPRNNFKQQLIRLYLNEKDINIRGDQFPKPDKWYEISISKRSGGVDYHVFIDDEQVSTAPINITANELTVWVYGSLYYSKSCNPNTSEFLIFDQPWWIIAASGGAIILLMVLITMVIILVIRRKRTSNRRNPMKKHAWSIHKSTSGDLGLQCQSFPTPEIRRQNAYKANDLQELNSYVTHTTAKPMQVQGVVYPANTCNKENTYKTISEIGQPVYDDEEGHYEKVLGLKYFNPRAEKPFPFYSLEQEQHNGCTSQNHRGVCESGYDEREFDPSAGGWDGYLASFHLFQH
ncbi:hypothetical protein SK128_003343, partial [Halocaridina rubra]